VWPIMIKHLIGVVRGALTKPLLMMPCLQLSAIA
jgi:hypothetical protein